MHILHYSENVYHQFFRKIDEVNYFLEEAVENQLKYSKAPLPKADQFFDKMQFVFSAFLGALVASWEIARLSIQLDNSANGREKSYQLPNEFNLANDISLFNDFFEVSDHELFGWFCFLKAARNASAHDGSCAVNGGNVEIFKFQTDLHRFEWDRSTRSFSYSCEPATTLGAVTSMLAMAYKLSPLFFSKLKRPQISPQVSEEIARFNIASSRGFEDTPADIKKQMIAALASVRESIPERQIDGRVSSWKTQYEARFVWSNHHVSS